MKIVAVDGQLLAPGDNPWTPVESLGELTVHQRTSPDQTVERLAGADVVLTNKVVLNEAVLSQIPDLKFIGVTATGYNVVDVEYARSRNIAVSNVPVYSTDSVAQHVFACLLSFIHRPQLHHEAVLNGQWERCEDFAFWISPLRELAGQTFGVVGLGRIGRATARLAAAFGMKVVAHSRRQIDPLDTPGFQWLSMEELFAQSDVVSLHCPQTPETTGLVNADLLAKMKPTSILVNMSRGGLINEADLTAVLNSEKIAGAILDVVSAEPILGSNPLPTAKNILITPHIAWSTIEARKRLMQTTADNIAAFQKGEPINVVN